MMEKIKTTSSMRREALIELALMPIGWLPSHEPMYRYWGIIPERTREILRQLKSSDIENDNWHLREIKGVMGE